VNHHHMIAFSISRAAPNNPLTLLPRLVAVAFMEVFPIGMTHTDCLEEVCECVRWVLEVKLSTGAPTQMAVRTQNCSAMQTIAPIGIHFTCQYVIIDLVNRAGRSISGVLWRQTTIPYGQTPEHFTCRLLL
jgi:hypothetical protein